MVLIFSGSLCLCARAVQPAQGISLGWDASQDPDVTGYFVHYGTASGVYSSVLDAGTNTVAVVFNLAEGVAYYFVVTSYNAEGSESPPSNEISYDAPTANPPSLAPVPDQAASVGQTLSITNSAVGADGGSDNLSFTLISAPPAMQINPTNGLVTWTPGISDAGTTNLIVEQVSDNSTPPLTSAQTFNVMVGNAVQSSLASAVLAVGQSGSLVLTMNVSAPVTSLSFELDAPAGWVSALTVAPLQPADAVVTQNPASATSSRITVQAATGETMQGQIQLQINLTTAANQTSAFGALQVSSVVATAADGTTVSAAPAASSPMVLVGNDSLLSFQASAGTGNLTLFGPAGASYQIQSTTDLSNPGGWTNEFSTTLTALYQSFPNLPLASGNKFYRAQRL